MELPDIKKSLSEMSEVELRELLGGIRTSRRTAKPKTSLRQDEKKAASRAKKEKPSASTGALINALNPEQIAQLLKQLGGSKDAHS